MENFLIVIIFIGSILYKVYTNYKKEMEKTKKRNPQQRPIPSATSYNPPVEREYYPSNNRTIPSDFQVKTNYADNSIPDEVRRITDAKKTAKLKTLVLKTEQENIQKPIEFDLRQAVIQSIILERPYK